MFQDVYFVSFNDDESTIGELRERATNGLERPMPVIAVSTDAIVRMITTTLCGTDLHILKGDVSTCVPGRILGHEGVGVSEHPVQG